VGGGRSKQGLDGQPGSLKFPLVWILMKGGHDSGTRSVAFVQWSDPQATIAPQGYAPQIAFVLAFGNALLGILGGFGTFSDSP
jgi:hypothetical protein